MRGQRARRQMAPGTGTQVITVATPPSDDDHPNIFRANGMVWKVGREYWDADLKDLVELTEVVRRSSWCDTRDAEDCPPLLVFESRNGRLTIDPNRPDDHLKRRFTLRRIEDPADLEGEVW